MLMDIMGYSISILLTTIETLALYNLSKAFLSKEKENSKVFFIASAIVLFFMNVSIGMSNFEKIFVNTLIYIAVLKKSFDSDIKEVSLISIAQTILTFGFDYLISFIMMLLLNITLEELTIYPTTFIILSFTSKLLLFIISYILYRNQKSKNKQIKLSVIQWGEIALYSSGSLFSLYLIMDNSIKNSLPSFSLIVGTIFIIACNISILFIINKVEDDNELKKTQAVLKSQLESQTEKFEALAINYQNQRQLTHDFNQHILMIKGLSNKEDRGELLEYLDNLSKNNTGKSLILNSNHPIIDILIDNKYNIAKSKGIEIKMDISDMSGIPLENKELVVILSNLLDNAIEASEKVYSSKLIRVKISKENMNYIISVQNKTSEKSGFSESEIISSKEDKLNHGYGIKNILEILKKYGYAHMIQHENYWFNFTILL